MATIQDLGKVAYLNKGAYNSETNYEINDVVSYEGSSYVSKTNGNKGNLPTNTVYWSIVALKGDKGETGKPFVIEKTYTTIEEMVADYDNMNINDYVMISGNIEEEQNATLWTKTEKAVSPNKWVYLADFSGASGITGATPNISIGNVTEGNQPAVTRRGTNENPILDFILKTGAKGETGDTGNGIAKIEKTKTDGLIDTYTITYTNGETQAFTVTNGKDGEVTETELNKLRQEIEDLRANEITSTPELSTNYYLTDSAKSKARVFLPEGNSIQETTEGYNILNFNVPQTGIVTVNDDGTITLNGKSTGQSINFEEITIKKGETYSTFVELISGTYSAPSHMNIGMLSPLGKGNWLLNNVQDLYTPDEDKSRFSIWIGADATYNNAKFKIWAYKGSDKKPFEKFTYGASPSLNYEQPIKSAGDNENLFDKDRQPDNYYYNNEGTTTIDGINKFINQTLPISRFYTISFKDKAGSANVRLVEYNGDTFIKRTLISTNSTIKIESSTNRIIASVDAGPNAYFNDLKIEKGKKATPYSPYGMGSINEKIVNKNLLVGSGTITSNGRTSTYNNGNFVVTGTATAGYAGLTNREKFSSPLLPGTYTFSGFNYKKSIGRIVLRLYEDENATIQKNIYIADTIETTPYRFTIDKTYVMYQLIPDLITSGTSYNNEFQLQLEQGSTSTLFVEHEEQNYSIPVQQPMRSIGEVRDKFVKVDGNWFERHPINRYIFTGEENLYSAGKSNNIYQYQINISNIRIPQAENYVNITKSNAFGYVNYWSNSWLINNICLNLPQDKIIRLQTDEYETLQDFKSYLAERYANGNPVYIYYILETPLDLPCTQEQIDVLENLPSTYKNVTHIISEDDTPAFIDLEYVIDMKTYIDNKLS